MFDSLFGPIMVDFVPSRRDERIPEGQLCLRGLPRGLWVIWELFFDFSDTVEILLDSLTLLSLDLLTPVTKFCLQVLT